jgi:lycopene cyclase domain-containing protein
MIITQEITYLLINIFTISFPLAASFDRRIYYAGNWRYLFPSLLLTAAFFIIWDVWFTASGIWSFNPVYLTGIRLINLPIEEWLFFITVPFSSIFIYEALNYWLKRDILLRSSRFIALGLGIVLISIALLSTDRAYTFITFLVTGLFLLAHFVLRKKYLGRFFLAYLVHLIPFAVVNGILTAMPVVQYNDLENLGFRMGTIPVEDSIYSMLLLLMNITLFEFFRRNKKTDTISD